MTNRDNPCEIVSVDKKIRDAGTQFPSIAWKLTLKNNSAHPLVVDVTIQFLDKDGFEVFSANADNLHLPPSIQKAFTGSHTRPLSMAEMIDSVCANIHSWQNEE
jgi:hypothetical protein